MTSRHFLALLAFVLPPVGLLAVRSWLGRLALAAASLAAAMMFFEVFAGPGLVLWLLAGAIAARMMLKTTARNGLHA
ncbi:MAG TPA: hypothetical protein VEB64_05955 [Azospirillaceae bacterium]|nr:hypothetical protein [Azospirillaceae bacterium]